MGRHQEAHRSCASASDQGAGGRTATADAQRAPVCGNRDSASACFATLGAGCRVRGRGPGCGWRACGRRDRSDPVVAEAPRGNPGRHRPRSGQAGRKVRATGKARNRIRACKGDVVGSCCCNDRAFGRSVGSPDSHCRKGSWAASDDRQTTRSAGLGVGRNAFTEFHAPAQPGGTGFRRGLAGISFRRLSSCNRRHEAGVASHTDLSPGGGCALLGSGRAGAPGLGSQSPPGHV